jgi:hypothetical protein
MRKSLREEQIQKFMDTLLYSHWDLGLLADKLIELKDKEE